MVQVLCNYKTPQVNYHLWVERVCFLSKKYVAVLYIGYTVRRIHHYLILRATQRYDTDLSDEVLWLQFLNALAIAAIAPIQLWVFLQQRQQQHLESSTVTSNSTSACFHDSDYICNDYKGGGFDVTTLQRGWERQQVIQVMTTMKNEGVKVLL